MAETCVCIVGGVDDVCGEPAVGTVHLLEDWDAPMCRIHFDVFTLSRAESDTSANARPDTPDNGSQWPESDRA